MSNFSRRSFLAASTLAAIAVRSGAASRLGGSRTLKVGLVGCGGRGTGAAHNSLDASQDTVLWSMGDVFADRLEGAAENLEKSYGARFSAPKERRFVGFDAYKGVIDSGVDVVLLCTPPHFRPIHLAEAVAKGKHVFMEKPVAVDPAGIRSVLASAEVARQKQLAIVAGTQRRHERCYLDAISRLRQGAIGRIVSARCYWNQGGLWMNERHPDWTDMEWQLRNWLYFTWLSGDHICEQHVHNLDVVNWVLAAHPVRAVGMGGRQSRTNPAYGHIYDHFAIEYEYPDNVSVLSMCRQVDGCAGRVEEVFEGVDGRSVMSIGRARIDGESPWRFTEKDNDPYTQEHVDLIESINAGRPLNEAQNVAEATLTAIMGRMSAYTGKAVTWEQALNSKLDLAPAEYKLGPLPVPGVAVPGTTPLT